MRRGGGEGEERGTERGTCNIVLWTTGSTRYLLTWLESPSAN